MEQITNLIILIRTIFENERVVINYENEYILLQTRIKPENMVLI